MSSTIEGIASTESLFTAVTGKAASAVSTVMSTGKACFNAAISGLNSVAGGVSAALKKGISFTATAHTAHPNITKAGFAALGLVAVAYASHHYYPAVKKMLQK